MVEDPASAPSNVTLCSTGSPLTQRTAWPAVMVTVSPLNLYATIRTSAATAPAVAPSATGAGLWNQGLNRFRCSGIVNSKPYSILLKPIEFPWIVLVVALLACSENVCGLPGMRKSSPTLQAARTAGLTNEP